MTTALQIAEKAIQLADENPDFVYVAPPSLEFADAPMCVYSRDGKGSCLFGQAIIDLGVVPPEYFIVDGIDNAARVDALLYTLIAEGLVEDEYDEALALRMARAQRKQDASMPWGLAVEGLREYVGKVTAA